MTDPFLMEKGPTFTWPRVGSVVLLVGITGLLLKWSGSAWLEKRLALLVFFSGLAGTLTIWFEDDVEDYEGVLVGESLLDKTKPEKCTCSIGWLFLLGPFAFWSVVKLLWAAQHRLRPDGRCAAGGQPAALDVSIT